MLVRSAKSKMEEDVRSGRRLDAQLQFRIRKSVDALTAGDNATSETEFLWRASRPGQSQE